MDFTNTKLSTASKKRLFFNAEDSDNVFKDALRAPIEMRKEVNEEPEPINPYASIDQKNEEYEKVLYELAFKSDATQTLVRDPSKPADKKSETMRLEDLPAIVRQAAEAALLQKLRSVKTKKTTTTKS